MANLYVRSTTGNDANSGATWALAKATLVGASAIATAGDVIYVSQAHAESVSGGQTATFGNSLSNPCRIICGNDSAEPPTAVATTATLTETTTSFTVAWSLGTSYWYGLDFRASSANTAGFTTNTTGGTTAVFENCKFRVSGASTTGAINTSTNGASSPTASLWKNCDISFNEAAQRISVYNVFTWEGGSYISGGTSPTNLIYLIGQAGRSGMCLISGVDLSALSSTFNIFYTAFPSAGISRGIIRNCKLPASWSGSLISTALTTFGGRYEMHNCDSADTNYRLWVEDYSGSIKSETTNVRTDGANDGTTALSWKMVSSANVTYPLTPLKSPEIVKWNDTVGSPVTVTIEILTDTFTPTDAQCWVEVQYLGTSGFPLSSFIDDAAADVLATPVAQDSSTATWTTTGLASPVTQKLAVTFTPQEKGFVHAVVCLAKDSKTVYVDPLITFT
jgi:hypothetical protein